MLAFTKLKSAIEIAVFPDVLSKPVDHRPSPGVTQRRHADSGVRLVEPIRIHR